MWFCNVFDAGGTAVKDANNLKLEVNFSSTRADLTLWSQLKSKQIHRALLNLKRHCSLMARSIRGFVGIDLDNDDRCADTNTNVGKTACYTAWPPHTHAVSPSGSRKETWKLRWIQAK